MIGRSFVAFLLSAGLLSTLAVGVPRSSGAGSDDPLPRYPSKEPAEALAEPEVADPVAAAYDEDGRLFVVEMSDYPYLLSLQEL